MKNFAISASVLVAIIALVIYGISERHEAWAILIFVLAAVIFVVAGHIGYLENMKALIWFPLFGYGAYWFGMKTIESIDFDEPFLQSFYWSTVGYFLLSLFLLLLTISSFIDAARKPEKP